MQQHHTQTALTDTTTNTQWQLIVQQLLVEVKLLALLLAFQLQLAQQTLLIYTDTHARQLKASTQHRVPDQDITIQSGTSILSNGAPVVIVWCTSVVLLTITQFTADTNHKYSTILLADSILTLLGRLTRIHLHQLLCMHKMYLLRQEWLDLWIGLTSQILCTADSSVDTLHDILQECQSAILLTDYSLPVPLVHVQRVQVVQLLISTDSVHIGIDTIARLNLVLCQTQALPFSQRVYHLGLGITQILDGEAHRALHTIQVVVNTQSFQHKQWCCYTSQSQFCRQVLLKELFYQFNTLFRLLHIQQRFVHHGFNYLSHFNRL